MDYILPALMAGRSVSDEGLWGHYKTLILKFTLIL